MKKVWQGRKKTLRPIGHQDTHPPQTGGCLGGWYQPDGVMPPHTLAQGKRLDRFPVEEDDGAGGIQPVNSRKRLR